MTKDDIIKKQEEVISQLRGEIKELTKPIKLDEFINQIKGDVTDADIAETIEIFKRSFNPLEAYAQLAEKVLEIEFIEFQYSDEDAEAINIEICPVCNSLKMMDHTSECWMGQLKKRFSAPKEIEE